MYHDDRFFWNGAMLGKLLENANMSSEWWIPVIQGHYDAFEVALGNNNSIRYYLISRRSKYRSGARYYSRGINENGNCANFIETEQIVVSSTNMYSTVFLSASAPVFW